MPYKNDNTDWISKEKRELFCKSVNTYIMGFGDNKMTLNEILIGAKQIVDTAFKNYPDNTDGKGEKIEDIIN